MADSNDPKARTLHAVKRVIGLLTSEDMSEAIEDISREDGIDYLNGGRPMGLRSVAEVTASAPGGGRCPVCKGKGTVLDVDTMTRVPCFKCQRIECDACDGDGFGYRADGALVLCPKCGGR